MTERDRNQKHYEAWMTHRSLFTGDDPGIYLEPEVGAHVLGWHLRDQGGTLRPISFEAANAIILGKISSWFTANASSVVGGLVT